MCYLSECVCVPACLPAVCIVYVVQYAMTFEPSLSFIFGRVRSNFILWQFFFSTPYFHCLSLSICLSVCMSTSIRVCVCMSGLSTYTQPHLPVFHFEFTPLIVCLYKNKSVAGSISLVVTSVDKKVPKQSMKMIMQMKSHIFCHNNSFGCVNIYLP